MRNKPIVLVAFLVALVFVPAIHARTNSTVLYKAAERMAMDGDIDGAITAFRKTLQMNSHYALGHYGLGKVCLYRDGMLKEAVYHLEQAVDLDKGLARGYFYLGIGYMLSKRYGQSLNAFHTAYELDRGLVEALYNMAVVYDLTKQGTNAVKSYERYLLEKNKRDSDILF
ncbi:MAG TPA: tetratricopeptide repeat protein [Spirochaetota bacterium]|nr:tetratricopeptide repeat protein [Spirochaetota bacterium]